MPRRYCFTTDLVNDEKKIAEYEAHHRAVWPEVLQSFTDAGIIDMQIYRFGNRLFLLMDVEDRFSFEAKDAAEAANPVVQKWEALQATYQQALPGATTKKWVLMDQIFGMK